jgi:alpha-mannosidase
LQGQEVRTAEIKSVRVIYPGPLVAEVEITYEMTAVDITTRVRMTAGSPRIDFETHYLNRTENHKLQVAFDTGEPLSHIQAESHLSVQERVYDPQYHEVAHMPAGSFQELKTNTGPIQRFVLANGHLLVTEGLAEYEVRGTRLHLTLLRAFGALSKADTGVRGAQAGPPFKTPEGQCLGRECSFRYSWQPAPSEVWQAYHVADCFYGTVWGQQGGADAISRSLIRWNNPHLVSTMIKWADDGRGLLIRLLNTAGRQEMTTFEVGFPYHHIEDVDGMERSVGVVESSVVPFTPFYVRTLLFCVK